MIRFQRYAHHFWVWRFWFHQDPIVVGIKPDSPYISRNYIWRYRRFQGDPLLLPIALLLTGLGLAVMTSVRACSRSASASESPVR